MLAVSLIYAAEPAAPPAEAVAFFERKILPVLAEHCYQCHSAQAEKLRADLRLDYRDGVLRGGATGAVVVPGDPAKSLLITAIKWDDSELQMPPKEKLPAAVIADFEQWVRMGAPDPRTAAVSVAPSAHYQDPATAKDWWSFQPVKKSPPPQVKNTAWPRGAIDKFVLAKLESRGLKPVVDADERTLIRRLYFDLTGLPPTPREILFFQFLKIALPTLDNLRNWLLAPAIEILSFFKQSQKRALVKQGTHVLRRAFNRLAVAHTGQSSQPG